jgi:hypothetical protein
MNYDDYIQDQIVRIDDMIQLTREEQTNARLEREFIRTIDELNPDTFITVNFIRPNKEIQRFDDVDAEKTCRSVMTALTKKFFHHKYKRHKLPIPYVAAIEKVSRSHAHILMKRPASISEFKLEQTFRLVALMNRFVARKMNVEDAHQKSIQFEPVYDDRGAYDYINKNRKKHITDSFRPIYEASEKSMTLYHFVSK